MPAPSPSSAASRTPPTSARPSPSRRSPPTTPPPRPSPPPTSLWRTSTSPSSPRPRPWPSTAPRGPSASPTAATSPTPASSSPPAPAPAACPFSSPRIATLRSFEDAVRLRARLREGPRVAIVGGGFIGLELASSARRLGCPVTVIEAQPRLLQRGVPAPIAAALAAAHEAEGVAILCGRALAAIDDLPGAARLRLTDGATLEADLVIVGIGALPETALAEAAGLAAPNGIAVDDRLATSDPAIFAAGDCCSFPLALYGGRRVRLESWRNAREQGALAGRNMAGADEPHAAVPWFWSDQHHLGLQIAGLPDEGTETIRRDLAPDAFLLFHLDASGRLVAASGIGPGTSVARDIRLAEMLIARRAVPPRDRLAAADARLKSLLAS